MYKLTYYVPTEYLEKTKNALFTKGGGSYQNYDKCCWEIKGQGQFRPLAGSHPYLGKEDEIKEVEEYRVEMICTDKNIKSVIKELLRVHPYEEVAYDVIKILTIEDF